MCVCVWLLVGDEGARFRVHDRWSLFEVLKVFQEGQGHMAVVVRSRETYEENTENIAVDSETLGRNVSREVAEASEGSPKRLSRRDHGSISNEELESLRSRFMDEEVVGVITMEDVLEELLQVVRLINKPLKSLQCSSF